MAALKLPNAVTLDADARAVVDPPPAPAPKHFHSTSSISYFIATSELQLCQCLEL